ncbi:AAA family ATPase [Saccharibacillus sacchari]|uniref:AAA family ATPase n=1 Tax=Saccharibacillus sacchari TaxID=456493 RepID=UPI0004ACBADC|nr:AAA family ATPase [Saccharibacillus sacchari]
MLLGALIKGYKSYEKSIFVPISKSENEKYSVYIGNNGVGKSAILEALDTFFNGRQWNLTRGATKDEVYIAPVFLIEKDKFRERLSNSNYYEPNELDKNRQVILPFIEHISNYFWNVEQNFNSLVHKWPHILSFFDLRESLRNKYAQDRYLLLILGIQYTNKNVYFSAFNEDINGYLAQKYPSSVPKELLNISESSREVVSDYYSYVYLPVEQSVEEILKVEAKQMQTLMNKDVLEEIGSALTSRFEINSKERSFITFLNDHLNEFMKGINESIHQIDNKYNYGADLFIKKNLTVSDIREKILEAYFMKKSLKYDRKEISQLSSGEQRRALIDIAYAFLSNDGVRDRNIILAIDEPEVSLSISNCYSQFARLEELANKYNNQILITTHWYGSLPTINKGYLHHIQEEQQQVEIRQFNFFNYLEERKKFPDDVDLKSMFDLASSILSYIKVNTSYWIICEGSDDKIYLETILGNENPYKILPVGGIGNVVKLFNLLSSPISSDKKDFTGLKQNGSKILCLIDTDDLKLNFMPSDKDSAIQLRRLQVLSDQSRIDVVDPARPGDYNKTVMEDCLDPACYYLAIKKVITEKGTQDLVDLFEDFDFNNEMVVSNLRSYNSIIIPKKIEVFNRKKEIEDFLKQHDIKFLVSKAYSEICVPSPRVSHKLEEVLTDFFK